MDFSTTIVNLIALLCLAAANPIDNKPCEITGTFDSNGQSCDYHTNVAAGTCIDTVNTQHEGDYCDAPLRGAHGCGPGNDGNIVCSCRSK
jgi:hypothetical protein